MIMLTGDQLSTLRESLGSSVSEDDLKLLLTPPEQNVQCWLTALIYLVQTGDYIGAITKLITCLIAQGSSPFDFVKCIGDFIVSLILGEELEPAFIKLFNCILGRNGNGNGGEMKPPNYREVSRCG